MNGCELDGKVQWTVGLVGLLLINTIQTRVTSKLSPTNLITYNEIVCDRTSTAPCPQWMYCDTLTQVCRSCSVCPHHQTEANPSRECSSPTRCRTSTPITSQQYIYCASLNDVLADRSCDVTCQPGLHVGSRNPLGTLCRAQCPDNETSSHSHEASFTLRCLFLEGRALWNGTASFLIITDTGDSNRSSTFAPVLRSATRTVSELWLTPTTNTQLPLNLTVNKMTSDNTAIYVTVGFLVALLGLLLTVILLWIIRRKFVCVCHGSSRDNNCDMIPVNQELTHRSTPSAVPNSCTAQCHDPSVPQSHHRINSSWPSGEKEERRLTHNDANPSERAALVVQPRDVDEDVWLSDDEDDATLPKTALRLEVHHSGCEISLQSFGSRAMSNPDTENEEETGFQQHSDSRSLSNTHVMVDDLNCSANARRSTIDIDDSETSVKILGV